MENYILSLIKENNRVIIPAFGAFIVAKDNGISVLFNNFLSFNDGLLIDHIVKEENISKEEASARVSNYVSMLKESLDAVGNYTIAGLGKFTKETSGILRFEQTNELGCPQTDVIVSPNNDDELLDIASDDSKSMLTDEESVISEQMASTTLNDTTPIAEVEEEKPEPVAKPINKLVKEEKVVKEEAQNPVKVENKYVEEDKRKRNRSITLFLIFFILVPLLGFSVYLLFFKGDSPSKTESKLALEQEIKKEIPIQELSKADADTKTTQKTNEVIEEPVQKPVNKPHHIIVGSFNSETNANKMITKLNAKGYNLCSVIKHNNRYLVSLESFTKIYKAQARQEEILKERMESWILTKKNKKN